eukprot:scaffold3382_cov58-Phaeocystis_antarctica.AAC.3
MLRAKVGAEVRVRANTRVGRGEGKNGGESEGGRRRRAVVVLVGCTMRCTVRCTSAWTAAHMEQTTVCYMVKGARCCTRGALYHARFEDMVRRRHGYVRDAAVVRAVAVLVEHARVRVDLALLPLLHDLPGGRDLRLAKSTAAAGGRAAGAACGSERGERRLATERAELHHWLRQPMSRRGGRRRQHQSWARHEQDGGGEH